MYDKLKTTMREKNISVNKLSFLSEIAAPDLYCALSGKKPMFPNWKKRIAEALNTDIESLFNEEEKGGGDGTSTDN